MRCGDHDDSDTGRWPSHSGRFGRRAVHSPHTRRIDTPPHSASARVLEFFWEYVLQHDVVQWHVCHQPLQFGVLILELFELPDLLRFQSPIPLLPPAESLLSNPEVADEVGNWGPNLRLLEYRHNLLDTESFAFHGVLLPFPRDDYAGNSPSSRYQNRGPTTPSCSRSSSVRGSFGASFGRSM